MVFFQIWLSIRPHFKFPSQKWSVINPLFLKFLAQIGCLITSPPVRPYGDFVQGLITSPPCTSRVYLVFEKTQDYKVFWPFQLFLNPVL